MNFSTYKCSLKIAKVFIGFFVTYKCILLSSVTLRYIFLRSGPLIETENDYTCPLSGKTSWKMENFCGTKLFMKFPTLFNKSGPLIEVVHL